jgi:hypothetical protein
MPAPMKGVAPFDLIRADFKLLDDITTLRTTWENEQLLLLQSVVSHAHLGQGAFEGAKFPNTTMDEACRALRLAPEAVQEACQAIINDIRGYVRGVIAGEMPFRLLDENNDPLLGMGTLRYLDVPPMDVLRGLYLGGLRDNADLRHEVEKETGVPIGSGTSFWIDRNKMLEMGLDGARLALEEWGDSIADFRAKGLIVGSDCKEDPAVCYQYVRYNTGPGASDDAAIVAAGFGWGVGVAVGVFLADAIDTLEKFVPHARDQDEEIALEIERDCPQLDIGRPEARKLTLWATAQSEKGYRVPDSSLRHLLALDRKTDLCAAESHFLTVSGVACPPIALSHERSSSHLLYDWVRRRMEQYPI